MRLGWAGHGAMQTHAAGGPHTCVCASVCVCVCVCPRVSECEGLYVFVCLPELTVRFLVCVCVRKSESVRGSVLCESVYVRSRVVCVCVCMCSLSVWCECECAWEGLPATAAGCSRGGCLCVSLYRAGVWPLLLNICL